MSERGTDHRPAPWIRTRLRAAPVAALLTAALAFGTVFLATALPRALDRGADAALRDFLRERGPSAVSLHTTAAPPRGVTETPSDLAAVTADLVARTGRDFRLAPSGPVYGVKTNGGRHLGDPELSRPDGVTAPSLGLRYVHGIEQHATLVAGRWPSGGATPPDGKARGGPPIPVAISRSAADTMGIELGDVLREEYAGSTPYLAEVVGLYTAVDRADVYWTELFCMTYACLERPPDNPNIFFWSTVGVVGGDGLAGLAAWGGGARNFWRLPVDTEALRVDTLPGVEAALGSYLAGPTAAELVTATGRTDLSTGSMLPSLLALARARHAAAAPLASVGPAGVAGIAAVVLCLAAALTADRRTAELRLLRARGCSRRGLLLRLLGENAVTVLPASVAGAVLALRLLPAPRWQAAVLFGAATALLALVAFPVRAVLTGERPRAHRGRRRLVGELVVLAVTAAAVLEVRRRGVAPPGDDPDPLLVAAPVLLALAGGLLLARLQPALVGALARTAGRRPALIGFLGLARAARGSGGRRPSVLPLIALVLAVTTAGFGATVLDAVGAGRLRAARLVIGGDAVLNTQVGRTLSPEFTAAAATLPGVETAAPVLTDTEVFALGAGPGGATRISVVVAEPEAYARISRTVGSGEFDPARLAEPAPDAGPDAPVPALFSSGLVRTLGEGDRRLRFSTGNELLARRAATVDSTPGLPDTDRPFVVLPAGPGTAKLPELTVCTDWLALGPVDEAALRQLVRGLPTTPGGTLATKATPDALPEGYLVRTSAVLAAELAEDPLQRSAGRLFWTAVAAAAGFALLAVLLTLVRAAPERAALLARLRTMGLRPRQGLALILAEALPQTAVAAVGGGVVALATVGLLGPSVDLSTLVGARVPVGLAPAPLPVLLQALGLCALVCAGVLAEALVSGRRQIGTELRVGDR